MYKDITIITLLLVATVLTVIYVFLYYRANRLQNRVIKRARELLQENRSLEKEIIEKERYLLECNKTIDSAKEIKSRYDALLEQSRKDKLEIESLKRKLQEERKFIDEKLEFFYSQEERLKNEFKNLADEILNNTAKKINKLDLNGLKEILNPLNSELNLFKDRVERLTQEELKEVNYLQAELKKIKDLGYKLLSIQTENMNPSKVTKYGNLGDTVLSKVLDLSKLKEGIEYSKEVALRDSSNRICRPNVIVYLPKNRELIIDSKISLVAYKKYIEAYDSLKDGYLKAHIASIKRDIDRLSQQKYEELEGINSLDFVFMFIPIENALITALEQDRNLFQYAYKKKVILVTPSTLFVSLKTIENGWKLDKRAKNISEVVNSAEELYSKVEKFINDIGKVEKSLDVAKNTFDDAYSELATGRGSLIRQIEIEILKDNSSKRKLKIES